MPPPQTRSMFMLLSRTDSSSWRYLPLVIAWETVGRNPVAALGENGNAVDDKSETLAGLIRLLPEFERSQAGPRR